MMITVSIYRIEMGGFDEWRFYPFTQQEASDLGGVIADSVRILAPKGSTANLDKNGRMVKLRWLVVPGRSIESDAEAIIENAVNRTYGFGIVC